MQKFDFPQGQWVDGKAMLNEFGQIEFRPEQKGIRAGRIKVVKDGEGYSIKSTKERILININFSKGGSTLERVMNLTKIYNQLIQDLREYEF